MDDQASVAIEGIMQDHMSSMMNPEHLRVLVRLLDEMPSGGFVLEIGTYHGQTAAFIARVLEILHREEIIVSIDPFSEAPYEPQNTNGSLSAYMETRRHFGVMGQCFPMIGFSQVLSQCIAPSIACLVVDGSHEYENVKRDLALYLPKIIRGGLAFVHDYWSAYPGVMQAVDEVRGAYDVTTSSENCVAVIRGA